MKPCTSSLIGWLLASTFLSVAPAWGQPLLVAANAGNLPEVRRLIDEGADINMESDVDGVSAEQLREAGLHGFTPLMVVALRGHTDIAYLLVAEGADLDIMSPFGTALMIAAEAGHLEVARLLIDHNANVLASRRGRSALIGAARAGHLEIVDLLLEAGAYRPGTLNGMRALQAAKGRRSSGSRFAIATQV